MEPGNETILYCLYQRVSPTDGGDLGDGDEDSSSEDSSSEDSHSEDNDDSDLGDSDDDDTEDEEDLVWWHALIIGSGVTIIALTIGVILLLLVSTSVIPHTQYASVAMPLHDHKPQSFTLAHSLT